MARSRVPMMFSSVLLPQPDGPTMATRSPRLISSETPRSTLTGLLPAFDAYCLVTSLSRNSGADDGGDDMAQRLAQAGVLKKQFPAGSAFPGRRAWLR